MKCITFNIYRRGNIFLYNEAMIRFNYCLYTGLRDRLSLGSIRADTERSKETTE